MLDLATRIREFATNGQITVADVARIAGRNPATVYPWSPDPQGKAKRRKKVQFPRFDILCDFADQLLLSAEYLKGDDGAQKYSPAFRKMQGRLATTVREWSAATSMEPPGSRVFRALDALVGLAPLGMLRLANGELKTDLIAAHLGISPEDLEDLRQHPENMQPPTLTRAAEFLGVSYTWLDSGAGADREPDLGPWRQAVERWKAEDLEPEDVLRVTDAAKRLQKR